MIVMQHSQNEAFAQHALDTNLSQLHGSESAFLLRAWCATTFVPQSPVGADETQVENLKINVCKPSH